MQEQFSMRKFDSKPVEVSFKRYARITPYIGQFMMTNVHVRWNKIETEDDLF